VKKFALVATLLLAAAQAVPAEAMTFLFIRHAESTTNVGAGSTIQQIVDPPLTALGEQQADNLAQILKSYDVKAIFTSAYQRTGETIAPTAAEFGLTPIADPRTNEWNWGDATSLGQLYGANVQGVMAAWAAGNPSAKTNLPNGESLDDMAARVLPAWQDIINAYKDQDGVVVIVGHSAETGDVMPYFAKNITSDFAFSHPMQNTGIIKVELINDQPYVTNWQGIAVAVPEPSTWLMLVVGFGAIGAAMRRRRTLEVSFS
jgi:broad specificity phosphatase PhoE